MYPKIEYQMSKEDLVKILDACKPTPVISFGGMGNTFGSPQENSNRAWKALGEKMGFDSMTVEPISGKDNHFFTAVPTETKEQKIDREKKEAEEAKAARIKQLNEEIDERKKEIVTLKK